MRFEQCQIVVGERIGGFERGRFLELPPGIVKEIGGIGGDPRQDVRPILLGPAPLDFFQLFVTVPPFAGQVQNNSFRQGQPERLGKDFFGRTEVFQRGGESPVPHKEQAQFEIGRLPLRLRPNRELI